MDHPSAQLSIVEQRLAVVHRRTGLSAYDFDFDSVFATIHPAHIATPVPGVARLGAVDDYRGVYVQWKEIGVEFINSPEQAMLADDVSAWYPALASLTPRTVCFDTPPPLRTIESEFDWPIFIKGVRQTSRHDASLAIARCGQDYERIRSRWSDDPILASQRMAVREWAPLRGVSPPHPPSGLPRSFEFRTFWWRRTCVGAGRYWTDARPYEWSPAEGDAALGVAGEAARRLDVPFLCVDVAQRTDGRWIVIEVNDAQRSGYAGVPRVAMWRRILDCLGPTGA